MKKIIICFILFINCIFCKEINAQLSFDYQEVIADSQYVSVKDKYNAVLNQHPFLVEKKQIVEGNCKPRNNENRTSIFLIALLFLFIFAIIKNIFFKHFTNLYRVFTTFNISKRQMKEQLENNTIASAFFQLLFFLCISYIIYLLIKKGTILPSNYSPILKYIICVGITISFYTIKIGITKTIAWIFEKENIYNEYQFTNSIVKEFTGLFLFPICIFLYLFQGKLFSSLLIFAIFLLIGMGVFKYFRLMGLLKKLLRVNFLHFFLYLCAFEIIPLLILLRLIR